MMNLLDFWERTKKLAQFLPSIFYTAPYIPFLPHANASFPFVVEIHLFRTPSPINLRHIFCLNAHAFFKINLG